MWCLIAEAAKAKAANGGNGAGDAMVAKLITGRFFAERLLPASTTHLARIKAGAASTMALPAEAF
jgi:acyl-CoA dehydrogenase